MFRLYGFRVYGFRHLRALPCKIVGFKFRDHHCYSFAMIAIIRFMTVLLFSTLLLARVVLVDVVVVAVVVAVVVVVLVVATAGFRDYGFGPSLVILRLLRLGVLQILSTV